MHLYGLKSLECTQGNESLECMREECVLLTRLKQYILYLRVADLAIYYIYDQVSFTVGI